jgi:hypothetical protein
MAQPPSLPNFEKPKYSAVPLFSTFWDFLHPFLKQTVEALRGGLTVRENLAAAWLDIEVAAGQAYPMREMTNPLPGGKTIHGVWVVGVFNPASPGTASLATSSVSVTGGGGGTVTLPTLAPFVDWAVGPGGGLVVLGITGLPAATRTVRVLVLAE